jgi:hypothetical protein
MKNLLRSVLIVLLSSTIGITAVHAAGKGGKRHGKRFHAIKNALVEVRGAITSLQDQIDLLVARVDTVEERVGANEDAIASLQSQNAALDALVQQNLTDIASIETEIGMLQNANAVLQAQLDAYSGDMATLQGQLADNEAMIATLQQAIVMAQTDLISLESSLQKQVEKNLNLITVLQDEIDVINANLVLKQNLVNGTCPNGEAMVEILADGSVVCDAVGGAATGQLHSVQTLRSVSVPSNATRTLNAYCLPGYIATSAGILNGLNFEIIAMSTGVDTANQGQHYGFVTAKNTNYLSNDLQVSATCIQFVP